MRLIRQQRVNDRPGVFERMAQALNAQLAGPVP